MLFTDLELEFTRFAEGKSVTEKKRFRLGSGSTVFDFSAQSGGQKQTDYLAYQLLVPDGKLTRNFKRDFWQPFYAAGVASMPQDFQDRVMFQAEAPQLALTYVSQIETRKLYGAARDKVSQEILLPITIGGESGILSKRIDWDILFDSTRDKVVRQRVLRGVYERLEQLCERLRSDNNTQGIMAERNRLLEILRQIYPLEQKIEDCGAGMSGVAALEREFRTLEVKDEELKAEQRTMQLLSVKNDYETLLQLRKDLEKLENNESMLESRLTGQGRDITVHELNSLTEQHAVYSHNKEQLELLRKELAELSQQSLEAEQETILTAHELRGLKQKTTPDHMPSAAVKDSGQENTRHHAPKFIFLNKPDFRAAITIFALLSLMVALFVFPSSLPLGVVFLVLFIVSGALFAFSCLQRIKPSGEGLTAFVQDEQVDADSNRVRREELEQHYLEMSAQAEKLKNMCLDAEAQLQVGEQTVRLQAEDLLKVLGRYAAIADVSEAESILTTLRGQRVSASSYDETVSDLLRKIAEVRRGRTDDVIMRAYEKACDELYGDLGETDDPAQNQLMRSQALSYDAERALVLAREREQNALRRAEIKERTESIKQAMQDGDNYRERLRSLEQRRDHTAEILWTQLDDLVLLELSLAVLQNIMFQLEKVDIDELLLATVSSARRLCGLRAEADESGNYLLDLQRGMRRAPLQRAGIDNRRRKALDDLAALDDDVIYCAFRFALMQKLRDKKAQSLILLGDCVRENVTSRQQLFDFLAEEMLQNQLQSIVINANGKNRLLTNERNIPYYSL